MYGRSILGTLPFYPQHGWQPFLYDDCSSQRLFDCSSQNMFVKLVVAGHLKFLCKDTKNYLDNQIFGRLFFGLFYNYSGKDTASVTLLHRYTVTFGKFVCKTLQVYIYY